MSPLDIAMMTLNLQKVMAGEPALQPAQDEVLEKTWKGERAPGDPFCAPEDSVHPDYIICLENGRQLSMLKRHLKETHGMTPDEYRAKWNLPSDYPMTAPNYTASKAKAARARGLGRHKRPEPVASLVGA
ncbi:MucR family transcriptional regulator [Yangia sp. PrR003]|nr:MucR family transcriptional regulator [Salipiger sp. PrR003]